MSFVAMPMTCHPSFERQADGVRALMSESRAAIHLPKIQRLAASYDADSTVVPVIGADRVTLEISKATGGAPFVGDPTREDARYVWRVAQDESGRWIAGDSELVWLDRF